MKKGLAVFGFGVILLAAGVLLGAAGTEGKAKVLMVLRNGDAEAADFMLSQEAAVMKLVLEDAGYPVVVATVDGQPAKGSSLTLKADVKMADVQVADYTGFIVPCMAAGTSPIPVESVALLKKAMAAKKPVAAQNSAVLILNQAGATRGRKFAFEDDLASAVKEGVYSGIGIVQDGNLVTSGTCPLMAMQLSKPDGTQELTRKLIALIK
jgi:putative intracellular protease/amidase